MKIRVAVIDGGRTGEHEVSVRSAQAILAALDPEKYEKIEYFIDKEPDLHSDQHRALPRAGQQPHPLHQHPGGVGRRDSGCDGEYREDPPPRAPPARGTGG